MKTLMISKLILAKDISLFLVLIATAVCHRFLVSCIDEYFELVTDSLLLSDPITSIGILDALFSSCFKCFFRPFNVNEFKVTRVEN